MIRRWAIGLGLLLTAGLGTARSGWAQARSSTIKGVIIAVNQGSRRPLEGARISLVGTNRTVTSDSKGVFMFGDLDPGRYTIQASAIGYSTMSSPLTIKDQETLEVEFEAQTEAVSLPELTVEEQANHGPVDWLRRKTEGRGRYITREQIEDRNHSSIPDALRLVAGVRIECRSNGVCLARMSRAPRGCSPAYFMDGIPADQAVVWLTPITDIEGIEVYSGPSETPPELESIQARCGVIALWTRPPPPRRPKEPKEPKVKHPVDTTTTKPADFR